MWVAACVALTFAPVTQEAHAQADPLAPHAPILIDGDADLCDAADVNDGIDADGIVNCASADGTPEAPYLIMGWRVQQAVANCVPALSICGPPPCSTATMPAAVAICNTTKHIRLVGLEIDNAELRRDPAPASPSAGLLLAGTRNLEARWINITAIGTALHIEEGEDAAGEIPSEGLRLFDVTVATRPPPSTPDPSVPLLAVYDSDVVFQRLTVTDGQRNVGALVHADHDLDEMPRHRVAILDSKIIGGIEFGLFVRSYEAAIANTRFESTNPPVGQDDSNANLALETVDYEILNNTFRIANIGAYIEDSRGRMQFNRFEPLHDVGNPWSIRQPAGFGCVSGPITYNEFLAPHVENDGSTCTLNVPYNYWAGTPDTTNRAGGPSRGGLNTQPVLPMPLTDLPKVAIRTPRPGVGVHGKFIVEGTAEPNQGGPLRSVEAVHVEEDWPANTTAEGTADWLLSWDVTAAPIGPYDLWIRACATNACGVPVRLGLHVVERPLPPIALLEARPRIAESGAIITLDASASYSPHARPIQLYRFDLGNGVRSDWITSPTYEVRYAEAGEFPASVEVIDAAGLQNTNLPQAIIRIRPAADEDPGRAGVPATSAFLALLCLVGAALMRRRE